MSWDCQVASEESLEQISQTEEFFRLFDSHLFSVIKYSPGVFPSILIVSASKYITSL